MTADASTRRLRELLEAMRATRSRWQHSYGSLEVIYADKADEWADELAAVLDTEGDASPAPMNYSAIRYALKEWVVGQASDDLRLSGRASDAERWTIQRQIDLLAVLDTEADRPAPQTIRAAFLAGWSAGFQEALTEDTTPDQDRESVAWAEWQQSLEAK